MKGIEITVIKDNGERVIAGFYPPWGLEDIQFINAAEDTGPEIANALLLELPALKEKLDRQERMSEN
jgi:hypothetical protein